MIDVADDDLLAAMKILSVECPDEFHERLQAFVRKGWAHDAQQTMIEALRRFLDSLTPELAKAQVLRDVERGLHGAD